MSNKIILIDTNILFGVLDYFKEDKSTLEKYKIDNIIKIQKLFKNQGQCVKIPDIVINEFSANFFNSMSIKKKKDKFLKEDDYKQWIKLQNAAWQKIMSFVISNKASSVNFDSLKINGFNIFNLALEITRYQLPEILVEKLIHLSEKDNYAKVNSGKLFDGMDSLILSYIFIFSLENYDKQIEFITNDNYFRIGAKYFLKNNLPIMNGFEYPKNLIIRRI